MADFAQRLYFQCALKVNENWLRSQVHTNHKAIGKLNNGEYEQTNISKGFVCVAKDCDCNWYSHRQIRKSITVTILPKSGQYP